jgi:hypothetical protein
MLPLVLPDRRGTGLLTAQADKGLARASFMNESPSGWWRVFSHI